MHCRWLIISFSTAVLLRKCCRGKVEKNRMKGQLSVLIRLLVNVLYDAYYLMLELTFDCHKIFLSFLFFYLRASWLQSCTVSSTKRWVFLRAMHPFSYGTKTMYNGVQKFVAPSPALLMLTSHSDITYRILAVGLRVLGCYLHGS